MSVIVTVAAIGSISVGAQVLGAICASAAASLGLRLVGGSAAEAVLREQAEAKMLEGLGVAADVVEVGTVRQAALEGVVAEQCTLQFADDRITLTLRRDIRGKLTITAIGEGVDTVELHERADALLGLIIQQITYREVVLKMKEHGFAVEAEERVKDGTVKLRIRRK